ncbi:MAG: glycoside hydrolase family 2 protein, partial [Planctomycetota bacterium]
MASIGWYQTMVTNNIPWPEHPRPNFQRPGWVNLNGEWQFDFDPNNRGLSEEWFVPGRHRFTGKIVVPFGWESRLSGIGNTEYRGAAWYSRNIKMPEDQPYKKGDTWLVVGACDWEARVWINGQPAGEHVGGYTPFDINLSKFAKPGEQINITIQAVDITDRKQPTGKQIGWYTRTSGIWQTVYLEPRGQRYIKSLRAIPNIKKGSIDYTISLSGATAQQRLKLSSPQGAFKPVTIDLPADTDQVQATLTVMEPKLWTPNSPTLYPVTFELSDTEGLLDRVESYFGLREVSTHPATGRKYQYIYLNGKPIYLRGALHQSFHPQGIYQYPDDATMRGDYELCKKTGLNFLRIHIKAPVPRELYWADKIGVLIMQDMPNTWQHNPQARQYWQTTFERTVERDYNNPSIFSWCLFNETWGLGDNKRKYLPENQEWVKQMYHRAKKLDPTRLIEDNSPCKRDHVITDIHSWHFYINDFNKARDHLKYVADNVYPGSTFNYIGGHKQGTEPLINSEYGG